jgi:hypothetical protein
MKEEASEGREPSERVASKGLPWYLLAAGFAALLAAPFLTWFNYGPYSLLYPPQVSLVWLFESGYPVALTLYLPGVGAALLVTWVIRRPFAFVGVLPAAFPLFTLAVTLMTFFNGSMGYTQALTIGVFTSLFGSALLQYSYFAYQRSFVTSSAHAQ